YRDEAKPRLLVPGLQPLERGAAPAATLLRKRERLGAHVQVGLAAKPAERLLGVVEEAHDVVDADLLEQGPELGGDVRVEELGDPDQRLLTPLDGARPPRLPRGCRGRSRLRRR